MSDPAKKGEPKSSRMEQDKRIQQRANTNEKCQERRLALEPKNLNPKSCIEYEIDSTDIIININKYWQELARKSHLSDLASDQLIGRKLWDFISCDKTIHIYKLIVERVRLHFLSIKFSFRCDSPKFRRFMDLYVSPESNGAVKFKSVLIREEPRPYVCLLDPKFNRSGAFLRICSWCKLIAVSESNWQEAERAIESLNIFGSERMPELTHTICASCKEKYLNQLGICTDKSF